MASVPVRFSITDGRPDNRCCNIHDASNLPDSLGCFPAPMLPVQLCGSLSMWTVTSISILPPPHDDTTTMIAKENAWGLGELGHEPQLHATHPWGSMMHYRAPRVAYSTCLTRCAAPSSPALAFHTTSQNEFYFIVKPVSRTRQYTQSTVF
ncbi:hypothetical protein BR93DRAFT_934064 [Coniochaeta sp. PMI_546]|nr:hypothetical protein BR93DRAFT_934064 [Coniochaeta sp. PMI_546]